MTNHGRLSMLIAKASFSSKETRKIKTSSQSTNYPEACLLEPTIDKFHLLGEAVFLFKFSRLTSNLFSELFYEVSSWPGRHFLPDGRGQIWLLEVCAEFLLQSDRCHCYES